MLKQIYTGNHITLLILFNKGSFSKMTERSTENTSFKGRHFRVTFERTKPNSVQL